MTFLRSGFLARATRLGLTALAAGVALAAPATQPGAPDTPQIVGQIIDPALPESSGLVASRRHPGILWTHNDSGNAPELFAIDQGGKVHARFTVAAPNRDWEDIASDSDGNLYLADIGNNGGHRRGVQVYRLPEPDPTQVAARPLKTSAAWELLYPAQPFDSEAFFVHDGHGYLISKNLDFTPARLYRFSLAPAKGPIRLEQVATLPIRSPVTGADISADGAYLAVQSVTGPHLLKIDNRPAGASTAPSANCFYADLRMEAVAFVPSGLLATDEPGAMIFFPDACFFARNDAATRPAAPVNP